MSKLYNTLEKIRRNESGPPAAAEREIKPGATGQDSPIRIKPLPVIVSLLVLGVVTAATLFYFDGMPGQQLRQMAKTTTPTPIPTLPAQPSQPPLPGKKLSSGPPVELPYETVAQAAPLNEVGVRHIEEQDYWKGIYYLQRASKLEPADPAPLINMAVGLAELGLIAPAKRLFAEAFRLAPDNAGLQENIALMKRLELAEANWLVKDASPAPLKSR